MRGAQPPFATNQGPRLAVRFLHRWRNYFRGDVACFPARMAHAIVEKGIAERVNIIDSENPPEGAQYAIRPAGSPPALRGRDEEDLADF